VIVVAPVASIDNGGIGVGTSAAGDGFLMREMPITTRTSDVVVKKKMRNF